MPLPKNATTILLIEDDERDRRMLLGPLRAQYNVEVAVDYNQAKEKIDKSGFDVVFLDLMLPRRQGEKVDESGKFGLDLLRMVRENEPLTPIVVISGLASVKTAMKVMQEGIVDFIVKDDLEDQLPIIMRRAELIRQGRVEQLILRHESRWTEGGQQLIFKSKQMQRVVEQLKLVAKDDASVLLLGETGTGKELIAREIHSHSPRSVAPFVPVNCGAISSSLVESELFGHEKSAFTGADKRKYGLIQLAHQGTLFLDEIADLPIDLQVKLLRVLQERTIRRVGGEKELTVNIRVIAATNKELTTEIEKGRFREDLFYRLAVAKLQLPPLRERPEDVKVLTDHFIKKYRTDSDISVSPKLVRLLKSHSWPGNVRELESIVQQMLLKLPMGRNTLLPADIVGLLNDKGKSIKHLDADQFDLVQIEKQAIVRALERFGTQLDASKRLGISESQLRRKIKDYGIEHKRSARRDVNSKGKKSRSDWRFKLTRLASRSEEFTTQEAIEALGSVSRKTAIEHLNKLVIEGVIERRGRGVYCRTTNLHKSLHETNIEPKPKR